MITITCTSCQTELEIDDAFAGGVCRCRHCGTIQTVPSLSKRPGRPGSPVDPNLATPHVAPTQAPKAVYTTQHSASLAEKAGSSPPQRGTGLDELAQAVASSGLTGTGLSSGRLRQGHGAALPPAQVKALPIALIAGGAALLVIVGILVAVVVFLVTRGPNTPTPEPTGPGPIQVKPQQQNNTQSNNTANPPVAKGAAFLGVNLKGPSVVFLIDRGSGTLPVYDNLREATRRSIASLSSSSKFQVVFWETNEIVRYPKSGMAQASPQEAAAAAAFIDNVFAHGATKIEKPLEQALALNPAEIVLATGKDGLDDAFVKSVMDRRKSSKVRIHTFALGDSSSAEPLKKIAQHTGGEFRKFSSGDLQRAVSE